MILVLSFSQIWRFSSWSVKLLAMTLGIVNYNYANINEPDSKPTELNEFWIVIWNSKKCNIKHHRYRYVTDQIVCSIQHNFKNQHVFWTVVPFYLFWPLVITVNSKLKQFASALDCLSFAFWGNYQHMLPDCMKDGIHRRQVSKTWYSCHLTISPTLQPKHWTDAEVFRYTFIWIQG